MAFNETIKTGTTVGDGEGDGLRTNMRKLIENDNYLKEAVETTKEDLTTVESKVDGAVSGYKGVLVIADTPTENGTYTPTESGTYANAGGLTYAPDTTDDGKMVQFIKFGATWVKNSIPFSDLSNYVAKADVSDELPQEDSENIILSKNVKAGINAERDARIQALGLKQDVLVSGSNIKTVNGESLLGSGDIVINTDGIELEVISKQIYDKDGVPYQDDSYVKADGGISSSASYDIIKFNLEESQDLYLNNFFIGNSVFGISFYDATDTIQKTEDLAGSEALVTGIADTSYILVTLNKASKDIAIASYTSSAIPYEPFVEGIDNKYIYSSDVYVEDNSDPDSDLPVNSKGVKNALSSISFELDDKLDITVGANLYNKENSRVSLESDNSPYDSDTFGDKEILLNAWTEGFNYGTYKLKYQTGGSLSPKIFITEDNPTATSNVPSGTYQRILYFDSENAIMEKINDETTATWFTGVSYVRFAFIDSFIDDVMINYGNTSLPFQPWTNNAPVDNLEKQNYLETVSTVLPNKLYFVKDYQSCIYFENVIKKNLNDAINVVFNKGYGYNRLAQFEFGSAISDSSLTAQIVNKLQKGELKEMTYDVVDPTTNNAKSVNIMYVGDSFTDIGNWARETTSLLENDGVVITEIGTGGDSTLNAEGVSGGTLENSFLNSSTGVARLVDATVTVKPNTGFQMYNGVATWGTVYEDDNGNEWTIRGYANGKLRVSKIDAIESDFASFPTSGDLTKSSGQTSREGDSVISYTGATPAYFNPFINTSNVCSVSHYLTTYSFPDPDIVVIQFTWNDLGIWRTDAEIQAVVDNFKAAADIIHTDLPSAQIVFSIEPYGAPNANRDWNGKKYSVLKFVEKLVEEIEENATYNTYCYIAPSYAFLDMVNSYSASTVSPCDRFPSLTEISGGDGVHPVYMEQIADCVYQVISNII